MTSLCPWVDIVFSPQRQGWSKDRNLKWQKVEEGREENKHETTQKGCFNQTLDEQALDKMKAEGLYTHTPALEELLFFN